MVKLCNFCKNELLGDKVRNQLYHYECFLKKERIRNRAAYRKRMIEKPEETRAHERMKGIRRRARNPEKYRNHFKKWYYSEKGRYYRRVTKVIRQAKGKISLNVSQRAAIESILYRAKYVREKTSKFILSRDMNIITAHRFINLPAEKIGKMDFKRIIITGNEKPKSI